VTVKSVAHEKQGVQWEAPRTSLDPFGGLGFRLPRIDGQTGQWVFNKARRPGSASLPPRRRLCGEL